MPLAGRQTNASTGCPCTSWALQRHGRIIVFQKQTCTPTLRSHGERDTLCPWTGLLIKPALVGTRVDVRLEIEESLYSFQARRRLRPRSYLSGKPLVFHHLRYAFQVLIIRSQCQNPGNYRAFNLIQSNIITLARSDEPHVQNYGKFMETPIPQTRT